MKLVKLEPYTTLPSSEDSANIMTVKDVTSPPVSPPVTNAPVLSLSFGFWTG